MFYPIGINLPAVLIANGAAVALALMLLVNKHRRINMINLDDRLFSLMCALLLILAALETVSFLQDGLQYSGARQISLVLNGTIFALTPILALVWALYVDYKLLEDGERLRRCLPFLALPAALILLLSICNLFTDVFFHITPNNVYQRLPVTTLPLLVVYGYLTYGAILVYHYRSRVGKYLFMPVLLFLLPIYVGAILQMLFYGLSLIWISIAFGLVSLYSNLQNEASYLDTLTNLYNRNYLFCCISPLVRRPKSERLGGLMLDINAFKQINDTYGHSEGDQVLQTVGQILLRASDRRTVVARYGGDEFVVLMRQAVPGTLEAQKQRILQEVEQHNQSRHTPYQLSLSIGLCYFHSQSVDDFFRQMDQSMYQEKRSYYQQEGHRPRHR